MAMQTESERAREMCFVLQRVDLNPNVEQYHFGNMFYVYIYKVG
jgi:hypothetical protein